ncbi:c-type cytochrome [Neptunicella marina]|uniref:C-type cytochrome n=1 Tax=Neptunicella marina TaxID=2125989 RepID=A0A8J6J049_9ALTE|nr:c-type cytochrome [Neptunicella marina]MBC3767745.1 c-type cytochrome [Neptunicella marina]
MLVKNTFFALVVSSFSVSASVDKTDWTPTPQQFKYCTVCHGNQLMGNPNIGAPRLSGLSAWYIEKQLQAFKQGKRGMPDQSVPAHEMQSMVKELSDEQIHQAAIWASKTQSPVPSETIVADAKAGESLYKQCAACHGADGKGNQTIGAPALAGLHDWYLLNQFDAFKSGSRGNVQGDSQAQQMQAAANLVNSEQDLKAIVAYIQQLEKHEEHN